jgi:hypothetical protein
MKTYGGALMKVCVQLYVQAALPHETESYRKNNSRPWRSYKCDHSRRDKTYMKTNYLTVEWSVHLASDSIPKRTNNLHCLQPTAHVETLLKNSPH